MQAIINKLKFNYDIARGEWLDANRYSGGTGKDPFVPDLPDTTISPQTNYSYTVCKLDSPPGTFCFDIDYTYTAFNLNSIPNNTAFIAYPVVAGIEQPQALFVKNPNNSNIFSIVSYDMATSIPSIMQNVSNTVNVDYYSPNISKLSIHFPDQNNLGVVNRFGTWPTFNNQLSQVYFKYIRYVQFAPNSLTSPTSPLNRIAFHNIDHRLFPMQKRIFIDSVTLNEVKVNNDFQLIDSSNNIFNGYIYGYNPTVLYVIRRGWVVMSVGMNIETFHLKWRPNTGAIETLYLLDGITTVSPGIPSAFVNALRTKKLYSLVVSDIRATISPNQSRVRQPNGDLFTGTVLTKPGFNALISVNGVLNYNGTAPYAIVPDPDIVSIGPSGYIEARVDPTNTKRLIAKGTLNIDGNYASAPYDNNIAGANTGYILIDDTGNGIRIVDGIIQLTPGIPMESNTGTSSTGAVGQISGSLVVSNLVSLISVKDDFPTFVTNYPGATVFKDTLVYSEAIAYINDTNPNILQTSKNKVRNAISQFYLPKLIFNYTSAIWKGAMFPNFEDPINYTKQSTAIGDITSNFPITSLIYLGLNANQAISGLSFNISTPGDVDISITQTNNLNLVNPKDFKTLIHNDGTIEYKLIEDKLNSTDIIGVLNRVKNENPSAFITDKQDKEINFSYN